MNYNESSYPIDYKFYCFNGKPCAILVMADKGKKVQAVFMSLNWEVLSYPEKYQNSDFLPKKPDSLNKMITIAHELSKDFPFVRVDLYEYESKPIFGEMTFTPSGGLYPSKTKINDQDMDDLLDLSLYILLS